MPTVSGRLQDSTELVEFHQRNALRTVFKHRTSGTTLRRVSDSRGDRRLNAATIANLSRHQASGTLPA
uniref:Uncharacterized protein n=1 Tax=mine drainage metagenome TaxID=410659 RepID=E6PQI7_9ZZZZ